MLRHGLCHGTQPVSSFSIIRSVMIWYTSIAACSFAAPASALAAGRAGWLKPEPFSALALFTLTESARVERTDAARSGATNERRAAIQARRARAQRSVRTGAAG